MKTLMVAIGALLLATAARENSSAGVMLGAHVGYENDADSKGKFSALEAGIGRKLAIDNDHEDWMAMPNIDRVRWDQANGRLSMLSWRIMFSRSDAAAGCANADAIVAGTYDAQLRRQALAVKSLGKPILIRFNYEMTNNEENTCFTGFPVKTDTSLAGSKYIAAWRHVVDAFRAAGASNVQWVWAPGAPAYLKGIWRQFYPGATYVDWIGMDNYNKTDEPRSFATDPAIQAFYTQTSGLGKPLMIAETGAVNDSRLARDAQTEWLTTAREFLKTHPAIKALLYWNGGGKYAREHPDYGGSGYQLQGPGLAAFRAMANDPYFADTWR